MRIKRRPKIKEKHIIAILREEFARTRKLIPSRFRGIHFSYISWYWFKRKSRVGECWRASKTIYFSTDYLEEKRPLEDFRLCIRHELCHLVGHGGNGSDFLYLLQKVGGHRYAGTPAYEGKKPKK